MPSMEFLATRRDAVEAVKYGRVANRCQWGLSYKPDRRWSYSTSRWVTLQANGFHSISRG